MSRFLVGDKVRYAKPNAPYHWLRLNNLLPLRILGL